MSRWVTEAQFSARMRETLRPEGNPAFVTGPGRSGAVAAIYASYFLKLPYVPWDCPCEGECALIVDTASMSGRTMRRAVARYSRRYPSVESWVAFNESEQRHHFWYERMGG